MTTLERITQQILQRLERHKKTTIVSYDEGHKRLFIGQPVEKYTILGNYTEGIIHGKEYRKVTFTDITPIAQYIDDLTGSRMKMLYHRSIVELAKKLPSWEIKNELYRHIGLTIPDGKTTIIAPNVFVDYIYPTLIEHIGANTFIGEEAFLVTHFGYPHQFEIGSISIGNNCLIGIRALISPGVMIGDNASIGPYAVVTHDVPAGARIPPLTHY